MNRTAKQICDNVWNQLEGGRSAGKKPLAIYLGRQTVIAVMRDQESARRVFDMYGNGVCAPYPDTMFGVAMHVVHDDEHERACFDWRDSAAGGPR